MKELIKKFEIEELNKILGGIKCGCFYDFVFCLNHNQKISGSEAKRAVEKFYRTFVENFIKNIYSEKILLVDVNEHSYQVMDFFRREKNIDPEVVFKSCDWIEFTDMINANELSQDLNERIKRFDNFGSSVIFFQIQDLESCQAEDFIYPYVPEYGKNRNWHYHKGL